MTGRWWVVQTRSRHEHIVADQLAARGVDHFLPVERVWYPRRGRPGQREQRDRVLFPSYVFTNGGESTPHAARVRHVAAVIPVVDQARLCRELASFERARVAAAVTQPFRELVVGRPVRIASGPMLGTEGVLVIRHDNRQAFVMRVTILGAARELTVDPAILEPV